MERKHAGIFLTLLAGLFFMLPWGIAYAWTDASLTGIRIKKVHIEELRTAIQGKRSNFGFTTFIAPAEWTDPAPIPDNTRIKATHITQMRSSITDIYTGFYASCSAAFNSQPVSTWLTLSQSINPGVDRIQAAHITQLRAAIDNVPATCQACAQANGICKKCNASSGIVLQTNAEDLWNECSDAATCMTGDCSGVGSSCEPVANGQTGNNCDLAGTCACRCNGSGNCTNCPGNATTCSEGQCPDRCNGAGACDPRGSDGNNCSVDSCGTGKCNNGNCQSTCGGYTCCEYPVAGQYACCNSGEPYCCPQVNLGCRDGVGSCSSIRWKTNVTPMAYGLDSVLKLQGVSFDWKKTGKHDIGLIAEEVGKVLPELVTYEQNGVDAITVDYSRITPVLIEAIKEQQRQIDELRRELEKLRKTSK